MQLDHALIDSAVGRFLPTPTGRVIRFVAGLALVVRGLRRRRTVGGVATLLVGLAPLSAGALDLCWLSAAVGGPLRGEDMRARQA